MDEGMVMNLPLYPYEVIPMELNLLLGLAIGVGFGFVLESGGLGDARKPLIKKR